MKKLFLILLLLVCAQRGGAAVEMDFVIEENYLIAHTLTNSIGDCFSSDVHKDAIVAFQNEAWEV